MSMPAPDFNQQLLAYLQTWRQILEQWMMAIAAGSLFPSGPSTSPTTPVGGSPMPFAPPMPFTPAMPFAPPAPPASADYAQQVFNSLQAWRQYLEQATGASPQMSTAQQPAAVPANDGNKPNPPRSPNVPIPPHDDDVSKGMPQGEVATGSSATWPPKEMKLGPATYSLTQVGDKGSERAATSAGLEQRQMLIPPPFRLQNISAEAPHPREHFEMADPGTLSARPGASRRISEALAQPEVGSAFASAMKRVGPAEAPVVQRSLFSTPAASAALREAGETRSP